MKRRRKIIHTFTDVLFGEFSLYSSSNAWWIKDKHKVQKLMDAFKGGQSLTHACIYAGITKDDYNYFVEIHPDFERVREVCESNIVIRAMNRVNSDMESSVNARWLLKHLHPSFNGKLKKEYPAKNITSADTKRIEEILMQRGSEFLEIEQLKEEIKTLKAKEQPIIITGKEIASNLLNITSALYGTESSNKIIAQALIELAADITNSGLPSYNPVSEYLPR